MIEWTTAQDGDQVTIRAEYRRNGQVMVTMSETCPIGKEYEVRRDLAFAIDQAVAGRKGGQVG